MSPKVASKASAPSVPKGAKASAPAASGGTKQKPLTSYFFQLPTQSESESSDSESESESDTSGRATFWKFEMSPPLVQGAPPPLVQGAPPPLVRGAEHHTASICRNSIHRRQNRKTMLMRWNLLAQINPYHRPPQMTRARPLAMNS